MVMFISVFKGEKDSSRYVAMAKSEPFVNGHPIYEPGELYFEFGSSPEDAVKNLMREDGHRFGKDCQYIQQGSPITVN